MLGFVITSRLGGTRHRGKNVIGANPIIILLNLLAKEDVQGMCENAHLKLNINACLFFMHSCLTLINDEIFMNVP